MDQFINHDVLPLHEQTLNLIIETLRTDIEDIKDNFKKELAQSIDNIKKLQQAGELETVGYLIITKLRTELAAQNYHYRVKVYNQYLYFDANQKDVSDMDVGWCYSFFDDMREKLYKEARKYFMYVTPNDVDNVLQILSEYYHDFVVYAYTKAIEEIDLEVLLSEIAVEDNFMLMIGEYMAEVVTLCNKEPEQQELEEQEETLTNAVS
jgi:hypothetical protein